MTDDDILREQREYYRARAGEYDEWFLRQGRYDRGLAHREEWVSEVALVESAVDAWLPNGDVLELACGTGLWTRRLAARARRVVAVDASPEVIDINRRRVGAAQVEFVEADLFAWMPPASAFDAVFFGFWLSHVPADRFDAFWRTVRHALRPGGRVLFVDSLLEQTSTAVDHAPLDESGVTVRLLNNGRSYRIVKIFYEPGELQRRLEARGWTGEVRSSGRFFVYGNVRPTDGSQMSTPNRQET